MTTEFRKLRDDELDGSYQIIVDTTEWLLGKGIRQWLGPLPRSQWNKRQDRGQNFGLFADGELAVILSLYEMVHPFWKMELGEASRWWLSTLATAGEFRGQGLGRRWVDGADDYLKGKGAKAIYLDCVHGSGFLPGFYGSLGFESLTRKDIEYSVGIFDAVLMRKEL